MVWGQLLALELEGVSVGAEKGGHAEVDVAVEVVEVALLEPNCHGGVAGGLKFLRLDLALLEEGGSDVVRDFVLQALVKCTYFKPQAELARRHVEKVGGRRWL